MSHSQAEKSMIGTVHLFLKRIKPSDASGKPGLLKMLRGNFPNFLQACDKKDKEGLPHIFVEKGKNEDEKIQFSEFLSLVGDTAMDYHHHNHGAVPCSRKSSEPSPARGF
ncbi:protein S100-A7-like [Molossus nigricans]